MGDASIVLEDFLAVEEPLEIRVGGQSLAITMRTPGHDVDLAAGFLVSEGIISRGDEFGAARHCAGATAEGLNTYNVLDVTLAPGVAGAGPEPGACVLHDQFVRHVRQGKHRSGAHQIRVQREGRSADDRRRTVGNASRTSCGPQQAVFDKTGGLHAAALFDGTSGELLVLREDVGRHNAVDKVVGWALKEGRLPLTGTVLMVSGRSSFELTQKASMAGIPLLASVSAPSSLAAELATDAGMTLVGFLRGNLDGDLRRRGARRRQPGKSKRR